MSVQGRCSSPEVGVLALQGCVEPHRPHLEACGARMRLVRRTEDLAGVDAVILPGGESTTMLRLMDVFGLEPGLGEALGRVPVWGICAGAILMARAVVGSSQRCLGLMDFDADRNGYGRQLESRQVRVAGYPVSFIRAPRLSGVGDGVQVIATLDGDPVWVSAGVRMATTFHPELTLDPPSPMHRAFVELAGSAGG